MSSFLIWCLKRFFVISVQLQRFTKSLLPRMAPTTVIMRSFIIHKAPAGLDGYCLALTEATKTFQSTRPSRASTQEFRNLHGYVYISIHKALAGLDIIGEGMTDMADAFQSTRPSRASTFIRGGEILKLVFQSTRPSRASTILHFQTPKAFQKFQSTRPSRASTFFFSCFISCFIFQSTRPSRASTSYRM